MKGINNFISERKYNIDITTSTDINDFKTLVNLGCQDSDEIVIFIGKPFNINDTEAFNKNCELVKQLNIKAPELDDYYFDGQTNKDNLFILGYQPSTTVRPYFKYKANIYPFNQWDYKLITNI